ncbi:GTP-binding protein YPT31/YPT8 [Sinocyclocheilus grahami]|uniref:GTP-binding protein YPT31/YPT8-like n=1 Tax=Sinocyclocheilus grahami TaxID=75366 RepID=UPI0007AC942F|nr:PREDICTED: GTP-binding protein YPT31/YPT8-like [Sinocyclocheilus grahami]XP_016110590.1 PREDICTED: GTP-binding protein YPT31/YPT8-like [Sinocyclocheilus grahami]
MQLCRWRFHLFVQVEEEGASAQRAAEQSRAEQSGLMEPEDPRDDSFDFLFKIILIGDSNVGKTSLVQSFKSGLFSEAQQNTIGVDFTVRTLRIDGRRVKVRGHRRLEPSAQCDSDTQPVQPDQQVCPL